MLNLRMLLQYPDLKMNEHLFGDNDVKNQSTLEHPIIVVFYLLKNFYGSFTVLRLKLKFLQEHLSEYDFSSSSVLHRSDSLNVNRNLITFCLPFLLPEKLLSENCGSEPKTFFIEKFNCTIHYNDLFNSSYINKEFLKTTMGDDSKSNEVLLNPYQILLDVFDTCQKLGAFK